jgi:hypothetical protein
MASTLTDTVLDAMLNAIDVDGMSLHSGAPGDGTGNVVGAVIAATFGSAGTTGSTGRQRAVSSNVEFTGATASANVVNFGLWKRGEPNVYRGYIVRDSGDTATNAAGEYTVTTATKIVLNNPS